MINFKSLKNSIPSAIRLFLGKALLLFIAWKIIYSVFLYDSKLLDHPLTTHVGEASTWFLNSLPFMTGFTTARDMASPTQEVSKIYHNDKLVLNIADACNGLELMVLYIGFIICMPSKFWRKTLYVVLGIIILDSINILRCAGLIYLREYFQYYFRFAHHYLFKVVIYASTFAIWSFYSRKINLKNEAVQIG